MLPELSRAAFEGILTRLGRGVILLSNANAEPAEPAAPFYGEVLEGHVGYLRLGSLNRTNLGSAGVGDLVNIEVDVLAKHVARLVGAADASSEVAR